MTEPLLHQRPTQLWLFPLILCVVIAQFLFSQPTDINHPPWLALGAVGVGVGILLLSRSERHWVLRLEQYMAQLFHGRETNMRVAKGLGRDWAVVVAALLTLYELTQLSRLREQDNYTWVAIAWFAAAIFFLYGIIPPDWVWPDWRSWWAQHRRTFLIALALTLLAFGLRIWQVGTLPQTLNGDEGSQGLEAVRVINGGLRNPFGTGWLGVPSMSFFFNSLTIRWMGQTVTALRLPWVLIGAATVFFTFLLVRQLKGDKWGLVAAAFLATYHYHIHYSRIGSNQVADPFFLVVSLWLLYRGLARQSTLSFALSGMVCGLAFYFYAGARLTPVVMLACVGYLFIREPRTFLREHGSNLLILVGAFLIVFAPMGQYATRFPDDFNARINMVGIIQSGWLEKEVAGGQRTLITILWDQFQRAFLAFNFYPDRTVWYGLRQPLLDPFFGSLFLLGLGYGTLRLLGKRADTHLAPLVAWWWGGMILGGMLTESPPSSQRLITLSVPACFFITLALWEIVRLGEPLFTPRWERLLMTGMAIVFAGISLYTYFVTFTPQRIYGGPHALLATETAPRLDELKDEHYFYFVGAPEMYWGFSTIPYLTPEARGMDIAEPLTEITAAALLPEDEGAVFIVLPSREDELNALAAAFPEGTVETFISPATGQTMVSLYVVSQEDE